MATINRRRFLTGVLASGAVVALGPAGLPGLSDLPGLDSLLGAGVAAAATPADGPLVLCNLAGGNDGLNTVVPYDNGIYQRWRGSLAIGADQALPIGSFDGLPLGFHPAMTSLQQLWQQGHVAVICGVEYPNPNFSHFQSASIWQTADPSGTVGSGWLGRWLDDTGDDPLRALGVGPTLPQALVGDREQASTVNDSTNAYAQLPGQGTQFMAAYKDMMSPYKGQVALEGAAGLAGRDLLLVGADAYAALTAETPPTDIGGRDSGDIGNQLDIVAELISYGLSTRVYSTVWGSFDTHADQAGAHASLLGQLDAAIANFMAAFPYAGAAGKNPVILTYSEFGRTNMANASGGTDHSSSNVVLAVGPTVKGGFYGAMPSFTNLDQYGNFKYTTDFRSVYATILEQVLAFDSKDILGGTFAPVPFL
jgi:uncharacterized protein (DUF1501 family)